VPAFSLLPLLVSRELGGNAAKLAWLTSAVGIGTVTGGILLGIWGGTRMRILTILPALIGLGAGVVALGMAPSYVPALAAMLVIGLIVPFVNGPIQAILQATVAAEYQGRVFTLMGSLAGLMAPVGLLLASPVAELTGVRVCYLTAGLVCLSMGVAGFLIPPLLRIEASPRQTGDETAIAASPGSVRTHQQKSRLILWARN